MAIVTYLLLGTNILIYIYFSFLGYDDPSHVQEIYRELGLVPARFLEGAFWQPLTSIFLHYPFVPLHLIVNMIGLWSFGSLLERHIGTFYFLALFILSGLSGSLFVISIPYLFSNYQMLTSITVGASGALFGLLGAVAVLYPRSRLLLLFFPIQARTAALLVGVGSFLLILFDNSSIISHTGHLGGLLGGFLYAKYALLPELKSFQITSYPKFFKPTHLEIGSTEILEKIEEKEKSTLLFSPPKKMEETSKRIPNTETSPTKNSEEKNKEIDKKDIEEKKRNQKSLNESTENGKLVYDPNKGTFYYK